MLKEGHKFTFIPYNILLFILIPWILTGLQNPYGCGYSHICLRIQ